MKKAIFFLAALLVGSGLRAQLKSSPQLDSLEAWQTRLEPIADVMINAPDELDRTSACNNFVPGLVSALKIPGSFFFPFDSIPQISILYPQDSSFRIITWQLEWTENVDAYFGAIQMRTPNDTLKLYPLLDYSGLTSHFDDTITSDHRWMGALYYNIVETSFEGRNFYTLFGFNANSLLSKRKVLEVLTFRHGEPVFGAPLFSFHSGDSTRILNRFVLQYKLDGNASMNYDKDLHLIIFDHLVSVNDEPQKKFTLVPDGTYEAFRWEAGRWRHLSEVMPTTQKSTIPKPVKFSKDGKDNL